MTLGWMLLAISGLCIVGVALNKTKHFYLAAIGFTVIIFIAIFYNLIDGAALHDPGIAALPIFLILASILFSRSFIPYFTLASILGIFAVYYFWKTGLLVLSQAPTLNRVIVLTILQVMTGFLSWMIVSSQHKTTSALDLSEERFRSLFMAAPIGIGVTTQDGRVLVYNESLIKMGGWTPDEFKLINVQDHYANPENRIEIMNILEAAGVVRGYETKFLRQDNSIFNVNMSIIPIRYGAEDALLTILEDISERKQAERELRESEEKFHKVFMNIPYSLTIARNEDGIIVDVNEWFEKSLGYSREEAIGRSAMDLGLPKDPNALDKMVRILAEEGRSRDIEMSLISKAGQEKTSLMSSMIIDLKGVPRSKAKCATAPFLNTLRKASAFMLGIGLSMLTKPGKRCLVALKKKLSGLRLLIFLPRSSRMVWTRKLWGGS
jgi:PAS domain S-box-containing protein